MTKVVCLNLLLGLCPNCKDDTDITHHPNNYDCPRFKFAVVYVLEVTDESMVLQKEVEKPKA